MVGDKNEVLISTVNCSKARAGRLRILKGNSLPRDAILTGDTSANKVGTVTILRIGLGHSIVGLECIHARDGAAQEIRLVLENAEKLGVRVGKAIGLGTKREEAIGGGSIVVEDARGNPTCGVGTIPILEVVGFDIAEVVDLLTFLEMPDVDATGAETDVAEDDIPPNTAEANLRSHELVNGVNKGGGIDVRGIIDVPEDIVVAAGGSCDGSSGE